MNKIVTFLKNITNKNTTSGRTLRTLLQAFVGIIIFFTGLVAIPGVAEFVVQNTTIGFAGLAMTIAVVTYIHNAIEQLIKWLDARNA